MRFKLLRIAIVLAALFSLSLQESFAQGALNDASVEFGSRTYEPLSSYMISYGPYNSYGSTFVSSLAFPFSYDNVTYDYFQMHGCGTLQFRPSYSYYYIYAYYYYTTYYIYDYYYTNTGKIFAYYASMDSYPYYATGGYMRYGVQGSSPNRVMVFDWSHFHYYYSYYFSSSDFNFQVRLYEQDYEAEIHYGQMTRGRNIGVYENYYGYGEAMIGFTGKINDINDKWINVDPGGNGSGGHGSWEYWKAPNVAGGGYPGSRGVGNRNTVNNNDAFDAIQNGDYVRLTFGAKIEGQWPLKDSNLIREYVYGNNTTDPYGHGDDQRPAIWISKLKSPTTNVHRQIHGPLSFPPSPYYKVIYDATQDIPNDVKTNFTIPTPGAASNPAFMTDPAHLGALDLTNTDQIKGGLYRVDDNFSDGGKDYEKFYTFNIALNTDLELTKVLDPKRREDKKYPLTSRVPVRILVTNRGLNLAT